ncbi:hypothetical protein EYB26_000452 [Talaromyces marneffei]|uniref:Lysophospholipase nte1 n=1 Tax=Talaromyces marneffei PM1 TaxID=1077442 RepID=A0A093XY85_TALMA|nr:uncharacterized protein EYB26_000452 [Talaromyces marneffei]QGA12807.1 hypothetical protein EYB26_000452 [Talaromyces marneffei]
MSVITATSQRAPVTFRDYDQDYSVAIQDVPPRRGSAASVSSYTSNYSSSTFSSTPPTVYSPTSPKPASYRVFNKQTAAAAQQPPPTPTIPTSFLNLPRQPNEPAIKCLPPAVYDCILRQLQDLHEAPENYQYGCTTCFQRDLHALALTSRTWERNVRSKLYNYIHIHGADSPAQLKKYRLKRGSRLKLLRRTLRERKLLANLVLELRIPEIDVSPTVANGKMNPQWEDYRDLVASVVMVCPNLERLIGFNMSFHHEFDRLTYALSTRKRLREHQWILGEPVDSTALVEDKNSRNTSSSSPTKTSRTAGKSLEPQQAFEFLHYHSCWSNLETLMLHSLNMGGVLEHGIFLRVFNRLPALRHLCISSFDTDAFTDRTLQFLPPLESLRLENLRGVTDGGIAQYVSRPEARTIRSLTLIEQNIGSLLVISKIFASLRLLEKFNLVQSTRLPTLPSEAMVFQPILASASLKQLHWDVTGPDSAAGLGKSLDSLPFVTPHKPYDSPNFHLAQSILYSGFPHLTKLRAPSDIEPPGILQSVCRPVPHGQALIPSDRYSLPRSSHGSVRTRPLALPAGNNLTSARIRAQTFIDMAAKDSEAGMKVLVTDHSDSYVPDSAMEAESDEDEDEEDEASKDLFGGSYPGAQNPAPSSDEPDESNPNGPKKVFEFRMPAIMGIVRAVTPHEITGLGSIPRFNLQPDVRGIDSDGGLLGWKHLLGPVQMSSSNTAQQQQSFSSLSHTSSFSSSSTNTNPEYLKRTESDLSTSDSIISPTTTTSAASRLASWGGFGSRSNNNSSTTATSMITSPTIPAYPPTPISYSFSPSANNSPWGRDTCNGAWNSGHPKDWWMHFERERQNNADVIDVKRFF